jgi:hypothetical protein
MKEQNKDVIRYHPAKERHIGGGGASSSHMVDPMEEV